MQFSSSSLTDIAFSCDFGLFFSGLLYLHVLFDIVLFSGCSSADQGLIPIFLLLLHLSNAFLQKASHSSGVILRENEAEVVAGLSKKELAF